MLNSSVLISSSIYSEILCNKLQQKSFNELADSCDMKGSLNRFSCRFNVLERPLKRSDTQLFLPFKTQFRLFRFRQGVYFWKVKISKPRCANFCGPNTGRGDELIPVSDCCRWPICSCWPEVCRKNTWCHFNKCPMGSLWMAMILKNLLRQTTHICYLHLNLIHSCNGSDLTLQFIYLPLKREMCSVSAFWQLNCTLAWRSIQLDSTNVRFATFLPFACSTTGSWFEAKLNSTLV